MLRPLFFLTCLFVATQCWIIQVSHTEVAKKLTTNVTLRCEYDNKDNEAIQLAQITRIRIMKFGFNKWDTIAKVSNSDPLESFLANAEVTGNADVRHNSFLELRFSFASDETIGKFKCEVDGYDINDDLEPVTTKVINIAERGVSYEDILDIIFGIKTEEETDFTDDQQRLSKMETSLKALENNDDSRALKITDITNRINRLNTNFLRVTGEIDKKQKSILTNLNTIKDADKIKAWPEGMYALPQPQSGCPDSETFNWIATTNVRITTVTGASNKDQVSDPLNLLQPVNETDASNNHYMNMHSCSKVKTSAGPGWPKGKYCIQSYSTSSKCPVNFNYGTMTFDRYNAGSRDTVTNLGNQVTTSDLTTLGYCCRDDGDVTKRMVLPATKPFYLYRFGGQCQSVSDMNVQSEWISLHTGVKDKYLNNYHPDGHLNNARLELCYYSPVA